MKRYELGGILGEVEGGEVVQKPGRGAKEVKGPSHADGGVLDFLPMDTVIYSDKIKIGDKTIAQRKKEREKRLKVAMQDYEENPGNIVMKSTLDRLLETFLQEEKSDLMRQEVAGLLDKQTESGYFRNGGVISKEKAREILHDGKVHGKKLTDKQRRFFGAMAFEDGGIDPFAKLTGVYGGYNERKDRNAAVNAILASFGIPTSTGPNFDPVTDNTTGDNPMGRTNYETYGPEPGDPTKYITDNELIGTPAPGQDLSPLTSLTSTPGTKKANDASAKLTGMAAGAVGGWLGTVGPLITTVLNRLGDKKNPNFYEDFGLDALNSNQAAMRTAAGSRDAAIEQNVLTSQGQQIGNRNRARSINTLNALDQATLANERIANTQAQSQYASLLGELFNRRSDLQNQRDARSMGGAEGAFVADTQDRDQFYTNLSSNLSNAGTGLQHMQKMSNRNQLARNQEVADLFGLSWLNNI